MSDRETAELEAERERLFKLPRPSRWDQGSWVQGAIYALSWVIARRGAEVSPARAIDLWPFPETKGDNATAD